MLAAVEREPGISLTELCRRADIGWGTLYHHVAGLREAGQLRTHVVGRRHVVYPTQDAPAEGDAAAEAMLRGETAGALARALSTGAAFDIVALAGAVDRSPRVVYYHVRRMMEAGLVRSSSRLRYRGLHATPALHKALASVSSRRQPR